MNISDLYKKEELYYNKYTDNLFSGMIDEGKDIGEIKEGLKIGLWKETFDENTTLEGEYIEGKNHGKWVVKRNDVVRSIKKYNKGFLVSDEYFDEFNMIFSSYTYKDNQNYTHSKFDKENRLESVEHFENDIKKKDEYYIDGELETIYYYVYDDKIKDNRWENIEHYEGGVLVKTVKWEDEKDKN